MKRVRLGPGGEFDLIRAVLGAERAGGGASVRLGPGDDCALLEIEGQVAVSTDLSIEGIHFRREWLSAEEIGFRAAVAALSDLAAMAAEPVALFLSLALAPDSPRELAASIGAGLRRACQTYGGVLAGGDVSRSPGALILDVAAVGEVKRPMGRAGSQAGDEVWVTGWLGGAAAAVRALKAGRKPAADVMEAFARPAARVAEARWLAERATIRALIDLSDGLAGDAGHLAAAGGVSIVLEVGRIPFHPGISDKPGAGEERWALALSGGEDYELCLVAPAGELEGLAVEFKNRFRIPLTLVGRVVDGEGVMIQRGDEGPAPLDRGGFSHFDIEGGE